MNTMCSLISAIQDGKLEIVRELIGDCSPSYSITQSEEYDLLCIAIKNKHTAVTKLLLTKGFQVNSKHKYTSATPLHLAIINGDIEIVGLLLDKGADINVNARCGRSPFDFAIKYKKREIIELLFNREDSFADISKNGITLLGIAVESGYLQVVERLLNCGVYIDCVPNSKFKIGYTPLCLAVETGSEEIVELLLTRGANSNVKLKSGETPLYIAVNRGHIQIVNLLLQHGAGKSSMFNVTINNTDLKFIQQLLTNKSDVSNHPKLLTIAVKKESIGIVEVLLQLGADINASDKYGRTALHFTALNKEQFFEFYFKPDPDPDVKGEIAKLLLSRGADVNAKTEEGVMTLHAAVKNEYVKVVEALLEYNADVNSAVKNDNNKAPLHISAQGSNELISKMLLSKGANINARENGGMTALHIATSCGNEKVVEVLLRYGANPDLTMIYDLLTPLHIAAQYDFLEILKLLLKFGAKIDSVDKFGITPLTAACVSKNTQIFTALLNYGADINILTKNNIKLLDCLFKGNEIAKTFQHHLVKVKTANLHIIKEYLPSINRIINELGDFQHECETEIEVMKREKVNNDVSFYDILTKDVSPLTRNENIAQVLRSDNNYRTKFPLYASMIESNFRKGKRRIELLEQSHTFFHLFLNNFFEFPYDCTENIFSYLRNEDLKNLVEACKLTNVSSYNTDL